MSISKKESSKMDKPQKPKPEAADLSPQDDTLAAGLAEEQQDLKTQSDAFHLALSVVENMNKKTH